MPASSHDATTTDETPSTPLLRAKTIAASLACATTTAAESETRTLLSRSIAKLGQRIDSAAIDRDAHIPKAVIDAVAESGLFALTIPEAHGGLALSLKTTCAVIDELAQIDRSVAVMVGLHAGLGTAGLLHYGSSAQQARWLPSMARGERIAAFAATEAAAGSDLMAVETEATVVADGLRVNGQKSYVTNGAFAGVYTLLVRTPELGGARAQSLICVDRDTPGVSIGPEEDKLGIRGSSAITLNLNDALVGRDQVIGGGGQGSDQVGHVLAWGRTLMSAGCLGTASSALGLTLAHVTTRRQFGRTLAEFPLVQSDCAQMAARIFAMESLVRMTAEAETDRPRLEMLSTLAKVFCSESAYFVCDRAIQLHGALGFLEPTGLPRLLRDCRITRIFEGANDVLLVRIAAAILASPPEPRTRLLTAQLPDAQHDQAVALDGVTELRTDTIKVLRARYGISVMRKQAVLWSLGQAEVCAQAALAALLRGSAEPGAREQALAREAVRLLTNEASVHLTNARSADVDRNQQGQTQLAELLFAPFGARTRKSGAHASRKGADA